MNVRIWRTFLALSLLLAGATAPAVAAPPAPVLVAPAAGAPLVQPIRLDWNATSASGGPIGSYTWQVGTTSGFTKVVASGFTNMDNDARVPTPTEEKLSGLPNGTYFWRVKATQLTGGATGSVDSPWSAARSLTVTGLGPAPAAPTLTSPANGAQFHVRETYKIRWSAVAGAHYYMLEADDESTFAYPFNLTETPLNFGTQFGGGWGNALTVYYRVRAVSADGVRSLPSAVAAVRITNAAPVPAGVSQVAPAAGASVALPFFVDWSDTPNPQIPGYDLAFSTNSTFSGSGVLTLSGVARSDYMITADLLAPGNYFWRVRAIHGDVYGPWSAGRAITVTVGPTPPNVNLFAIIAEPGNGYGGNAVQARVMLDNPAPAGGAVIKLSTDLPQVQLPLRTVAIPAGKTDAIVTSIGTGPVPNNGVSVGIIGDLFAGFSRGVQQSSLGVLPILYGTGLSKESVIGGNSFAGTVTLQSAAPWGGVTVRLVSSDTGLVRPPPTVFIPEGATDADITIATSAVSVPTRVIIESGTDIDGYRAPQSWILVRPAGSAAAPPSLTSLTLSQPSVLAGGTVTGTVRLTSPAPTGGAVVTLQGSMEGEVIVPPSVTVPAGSVSASFTTTPAPEVTAPHWVFIGAHYGTSGGAQARVLKVDPVPGAPTLLAMGPAGQDVIGGKAARATVALAMPAPAGGAAVNLSTDNPSVIQVPASVSIPEGNSAISFAIGTSVVSTYPSGGNITATAGGVTKAIFVTVTPDPNAPPILQSIAFNPSTVVGGTTATGTIFLNSPAPSGGMEATLFSNNRAATPQAVVTVPAGQTSANFSTTTTAVTANTVVTISAAVGSTSRSGTLTLTSGAAPSPTPKPTTTLPAPSLVSPAADARFAPGTNITFNWSDVSGAASYTIQISDQSSFPAPMIVNQSVTASQFSSSTLPTKTMWWRVRATSASGVAGTWSAARRFEVKN